MPWSTAEPPDLHGSPHLLDLRGRTAIVTGANSGIGWQAAKGLALRGCHVVLACRDLARARAAADRIRAAQRADGSSRNAVRDGEVEVARLDLSSMASVQEFAESRIEPIDFLINNAGVMSPPRRVMTRDGFELQFATNHLGHFALTGLLLPLLLRTETPRVVTVSSLAHRSGGADVVDANALGPYKGSRSYANTKLANLLFAQELQRRAVEHGARLTSTAAHPGLAATGLVCDPNGLGAFRALRLIGPSALRLIVQSAAAGARPTLYAALVAEPGSYSGPQHFGETRGGAGPARMSELASDARLAYKLWGVSEDLTGFRYAWPAEAEVHRAAG